MIKINKTYQPVKIKNTNTLAIKVVEKLIKYIVKVNDIVCDFFSGAFTTQFAALKLQRKAWGCEINQSACQHYYQNKVDLEGYDKSHY